MNVASAKLPDSATALGQAARDAARGMTLTFQFTFENKASLVTGDPSRAHDGDPARVAP